MYEALNQKLFSALSELKIIPQENLDVYLKEANSKGLSLGDLLLEKDLIADKNLGMLMANLYGVPYIDLSREIIPSETLRLIPEIVAKKHGVLAFKEDEKGLSVAVTKPDNKEIIEFIRKKAGLDVIAFYASKRDFNNALSLYNKNFAESFEEVITKNISLAKSAVNNSGEAPIIKIVDTTLLHAFNNKASDIHLEPQEEFSLVRFRIDGLLHDVIHLPLDIHDQVVTRIKVMAKLRTDEHQTSQDGKLQFAGNDGKIDIRVSVVPIVKGEKIVMRLLSENSRQFSLEDLGMENSDLVKVRNSSEKPFGMILSTGPTGCGKTTTMYAILKILNNRKINIMTIEDPVEYDIDGINQIQVNPKTNLTFASGLRSILRQDPNVILVGEIRDEETADIAVNAAMTGHLVLSTIHTNDAATAIPRLVDMGIEPFLLTSTINCLIAQRLVRKICPSCRVSKEVGIELLLKNFPETQIKDKIGTSESIRVYEGKGCEVCHGSGYQGRVGIFEILILDNAIAEAITRHADAGELKELAVKNGMKTMLEDGMEKVTKGITTLEEIVRVMKE